ncbi:zinc finger protein 485-like isoform X1 [Homarus americanus]|uniref:zinc finger protein 485-like isoform X1 n=1 Tax=Homarus americanus TaxID=6706 RepID=UPI001C4811CE|nr:zinc finger protein 485-like isoform X1 [Homarus americanus]
MMAAAATDGGGYLVAGSVLHQKTIPLIEKNKSGVSVEEKVQLTQESSVKTESLCLTCGSPGGSFSAFTRVGNAEPLINLLGYILKRSVADIDLFSDVVCSKCFKKFETIEKLLCKFVDVCRDTIQNFNKAVKVFLKSIPSQVIEDEDGQCLLVLNGVDLKTNENGIVARALSLASMRKVDKRNESKPERKFKCPVCDKAFRAYSHRVEHMLIHTKDKSFKCDICGFLTSTKSNLVKHRQQHTEECICTICNKKLCNKFSLKDHMKIHNNDKPHHCEYCQKTFLRERDKRIHEKIHMAESPGLHQCKVCKKCFAIKSRLARHMLIHQKEKQFVCQVCNKKFVRKDDLKCHERVHTGEKPYSCKECGKVFRYISNCRNHMRIHMKDTSVYKCKHCNLSFPTEGKYSSHLKTRNHKKKLSEPVCDPSEHVYCDGYKLSFNLTDDTLHKTLSVEKKQKQGTVEEHLYCSMCCLTFENVEQFSEHTINSHVEGNTLSENTDTGIIISSVDVGSDTDIVSLTPLERLTVTGEGVNMMVSMHTDSTSLQIPLVQQSVSTTTLLPANTIIDDSHTSSTILPLNLESKATSILSRSGVPSTALTEISDSNGMMCSETIEQPAGDSTLSTSGTVTILNPSTIFKLNDWDISQYYQKS